jgi:ABC-type transport system involved in cytochrome bd biosynthesis fused ATPase/permease subunit
MDGGKVAEYGTHEELMAQQGIYYKLVELQTKALSLQGKREAENQNIMIE